MSRRTGIVLAVIGFVLHAAIAVFPFAATGLLAPLWGVVAVFVLWFALLVVAIRWARDDRRRSLVLAVPFIALAGWFAFVTFGDLVLGWTA